MDSVTNGEISEECLGKTKEASNDLDSKENVEEKTIDEAKEASKGETSVVDDNSVSDLTLQTTSENKEKSNLEQIALSSTSGLDESNDSEFPQVVNETVKSNTNESLESPITKENGPLSSINLPNTNDAECNQLTKDSVISEKLESNSNTSVNMPISPEDSKGSSICNESLLKNEKISNDELSLNNKNCLDTSCSKNYEKEDSILSQDDDDECIVLDDDNSKDSNSFKSSSVKEVNEVKISKNHFMAGGSVISSKDQSNDQRLCSGVNPENVAVNFQKRLSETLTEQEVKAVLDISSNSTINNMQTCSEQPVNFTTNKEQKSSNESKTEISDVSLVDLTVNKWPQENPIEKLNEHLNSIGTEKERIPLNHIQKSEVYSSINAPLPKKEKSHSPVISDKENENVDSHPHERSHKESSDSFVFAELSKEEMGFPDAFTGLVEIGKYISVKGDFTLRSTEALIESPSLVAPYLLKEPDSFPPKEKDSKSEIKDFFRSAAGEILIGIGLSRTREFYHRDMVRIKKRQIKRNGKTPQLEEELKMHENFYAEAKKANSVYSFTYSSCKTCGFTSESSVVMEGHLLVPHITPRREYQCNFCDAVDRDPKAMLDHMVKEHAKVGRIQPPIFFFECPYCSFESNSKVKLNNHLAKCQRYFDHGINQAPPKDFEFPALTPKPITVAVVKAYEKSLGSMQRGRGRPKKDISESLHMNQFSSNANLAPLAPNHIPTFRAGSNSPLADSLSVQNQMIPPIQMPNMNLRPAHGNMMGQLRPAMPHLHMPPPNRFFHFVNPSGQVMPMMGNNHLVTSASQFPFSTSIDSSVSKKASSSNFNPMLSGNLRQQAPSKGMPSVTITPLPKLQGPYPVPMAKPAQSSGNTSMQSNSLVVCEICDGYIKDLEQLRTHMQLIHKVKIHPKMLVSRPPLNCQKCQWRFFTDQGLERHLLGAHGLVTSNMQELANKGKDAGCCTICGRVFASKLVSHMNQVHKITLKPAHLSYKCTVCSATFNLYRLFENHVYLVHSGAAKRSVDGRSSPSKRIKASGDSLADMDCSNHKEKNSSKDHVGDENINKCKECGSNIGKDKISQNEKCDKCLKSDELVQGTLSTKTLNDELRKTDKTAEKAAA
ncbi:MOG interacting and ectopic P-granules protein 1 [Trichonephila inaurata madagascariensis]|uniref:MOG interacting and ectopic P-granules protein 1 n=1 Tax=Trichonephila inaurata madagascariensis TaxID=2747483 RepID=A0A8X6WQI3_9ARAC|nr:MOG interacting and ectopic P-granules protein 1 [Trichonephila inaurata madagascariensis]